MIVSHKSVFSTFVCLYFIFSPTGVPKPEGGGRWGDISPQYFDCIPPNNLSIVCILKLLGGFWCSLNLLFTVFLLVFTEFALLKKIVVEVHPPKVENGAKLG